MVFWIFQFWLNFQLVIDLGQAMMSSILFLVLVHLVATFSTSILDPHFALLFFSDSETALSYMHVTAHVSMCASVFMMVALTLERHFAIWWHNFQIIYTFQIKS